MARATKFWYYTGNYGIPISILEEFEDDTDNEVHFILTIKRLLQRVRRSFRRRIYCAPASLGYLALSCNWRGLCVEFRALLLCMQGLYVKDFEQTLGLFEKIIRLDKSYVLKDRNQVDQ
jgi:hypothetical protein